MHFEAKVQFVRRCVLPCGAGDDAVRVALRRASRCAVRVGAHKSRFVHKCEICCVPPTTPCSPEDTASSRSEQLMKKSSFCRQKNVCCSNKHSKSAFIFLVSSNSSLFFWLVLFVLLASIAFLLFLLMFRFSDIVVDAPPMTVPIVRFSVAVVLVVSVDGLLVVLDNAGARNRNCSASKRKHSLAAGRSPGRAHIASSSASIPLACAVRARVRDRLTHRARHADVRGVVRALETRVLVLVGGCRCRSSQPSHTCLSLAATPCARRTDTGQWRRQKSVTPSE
jgi:hypothetical protein